MKQEDMCFPYGCCAQFAQLVREVLGFEIVGGRCLLQRKKSGEQRKHAANLTPDAKYIIDGTLSQFDYTKYEHLVGSIEEPAPANLIHLIEAGIQDIVLMPVENPVFTIIAEDTKELVEAPISFDVREVLKRLNPKMFPLPPWL